MTHGQIPVLVVRRKESESVPCNQGTALLVATRGGVWKKNLV